MCYVHLLTTKVSTSYSYHLVYVYGIALDLYTGSTQFEYRARLPINLM